MGEWMGVNVGGWMWWVDGCGGMSGGVWVCVCVCKDIICT